MSALVSIIIPCYNQAKYLRETLESVCNQIYTNWECIIVDDGSIDDSAKIAATYSNKDLRFIYVYKENGGVSSARNLGIESAKGKYLQFLDADDVLDSQKIIFSLQEFDKNKNLQIVVTNFIMMSTDSKEFYPAFCELKEESISFENFLYNFFSIQLQCGLFNTNLFETIRFPENLSAQEDWVVWVLILKKKPSYCYIDLPLAFYRINPSGRMNTLGADDNQIKVLVNLKEILTYDEFYQYTVNAVAKNFRTNKILSNNIIKLKKSTEFKIGLFLKKIVKQIGLIVLVKYFFKRGK